jgi:hypothetical protein
MIQSENHKHAKEHEKTVQKRELRDRSTGTTKDQYEFRPSLQVRQRCTNEMMVEAPARRVMWCKRDQGGS